MNLCSKTNFVWSLLLVAMLSACATTKPPENFILTPVASDDASKRFTYGVRVSRAGGRESAGGTGQGRQGGAPGGGANQRVDFEQLRDGLEDYMALNSYCTQGYFIYDETYNGNEYLLHGECQESKDDE